MYQGEPAHGCWPWLRNSDPQRKQLSLVPVQTADSPAAVREKTRGWTGRNESTQRCKTYLRVEGKRPEAAWEGPEVWSPTSRPQVLC
ncbi:hypothetical protein LEMLEM_LOCUS25441 [Lemmus lemmus]